jgi:hypothetical protein
LLDLEFNDCGSCTCTGPTTPTSSLQSTHIRTEFSRLINATVEETSYRRRRLRASMTSSMRSFQERVPIARRFRCREGLGFMVRIFSGTGTEALHGNKRFVDGVVRLQTGALWAVSWFGEHWQWRTASSTCWPCSSFVVAASAYLAATTRRLLCCTRPNSDRTSALYLKS